MGATKREVYTPEQLQLADTLRALAHPARVAMLEQLLSDPCCICKSFTDELDLAQPTVSRHLNALEAAGIICGTSVGTTRRYCINPLRWSEVSAVVHTFLRRLDNHIAAC